MNETALVASLALTAILPLSCAALLAMQRKHVQLSPRSAMDSAAVERFDSEPERHAFHADLALVQTARCETVLARYRVILDGRLRDIDPRKAADCRLALEASDAISAQAAAEMAKTVPAAHPSEANAPVEPQTESAEASPLSAPVRSRVALWRSRLNAPRSNGSSN